MSIHKTSDGTWRVKYRDHGRQVSKNFPTKALATRFDADVKERKIEGRPLARLKDAPTLEDFAIRWLAQRDDLSGKTQASYALALENHVMPFLGHLRVHGSELRPVVLANWKEDRLKAGAGKESIRKAQVALTQIFNRAVLPYELLESNPMAPVGTPKQKRKEPRYLTAVEVERIRMVFIEQEDLESATLVSVLAYVGIRPQDALALTWSHVNEELSVFQKDVDGEIIPGAKTGLGYRRGVNLPEPVRKDLEGWRALIGGRASRPVFPMSNGLFWNEDRYRNWRGRRFDYAVKRSGLGDLTPYALRHTCASLLAAAGWNHLEIAKQLGHSPETSVRVYQHLINAGNGPRRSIDEWIADARNEVRPSEKLGDLSDR